MSEVIEQESTELEMLPPAETALQVYQTPNGLDPYIERVRQEVVGHKPNLKTDKGRKEIASRAFKVRKIKSAMDALGKDQVDRLKEVPKLIDAERKRMRDEFDAMAEEVRRPLTEWEEAEEARIAKHKGFIDRLVSAALIEYEMTAQDIRGVIAGIEATVVGESLEEFEAEAHRLKAKTLESLAGLLATREKLEADQAELSRLKAEDEARRIQDEKERIAREAAEAATKAAEAKAQAERDAAAKATADAKAAADRRELELKLQAETAERERLEAIQKAEKEKADAAARAEHEKRDAEERQRQAVEAERKRQADEAARIEAEAKAREADREHKAKINGTALDAFVAGGLSEDCAKQAVMLIAKGLIPAIAIHY